MRTVQCYAESKPLLGAFRNCAEYAVTVGLALLCGYWIVYGRW
jgi:hypothetical protein